MESPVDALDLRRHWEQRLGGESVSLRHEDTRIATVTFNDGTSAVVLRATPTHSVREEGGTVTVEVRYSVVIAVLEGALFGVAVPGTAFAAAMRSITEVRPEASGLRRRITEEQVRTIAMPSPGRDWRSLPAGEASRLLLDDVRGARGFDEQVVAVALVDQAIHAYRKDPLVVTSAIRAMRDFAAAKGGHWSADLADPVATRIRDHLSAVGMDNPLLGGPRSVERQLAGVEWRTRISEHGTVYEVSAVIEAWGVGASTGSRHQAVAIRFPGQEPFAVLPTGSIDRVLGRERLEGL